MKISDKECMDFLDREPLIGFVLLGRLSVGKMPVIGANNLREAIYQIIGGPDIKRAALRAASLKRGGKGSPRG